MEKLNDKQKNAIMRLMDSERQTVIQQDWERSEFDDFPEIQTVIDNIKSDEETHFLQYAEILAKYAEPEEIENEMTDEEIDKMLDAPNSDNSDDNDGV
jgi:predicted metal-dependent peptidase